MTATPKRRHAKGQTSPGTDLTSPDATQTPRARMSVFKKKFIESLSCDLSPLEKFKQAARAWALQPEVMERKDKKLEKRRLSEFRKMAKALSHEQNQANADGEKMPKRRTMSKKKLHQEKTSKEANDDDAAVTVAAVTVAAAPEPDSDSEGAF